MKIQQSTFLLRKWPLIGAFLLLGYALFAQEMPPRPMVISVSLVQNLSFGSFTPFSSGGSVIVSPLGVRSSTGSIILVGSSYSTALFYVEANPGTLISILNGPDIVLNGSNGGSMTLHIGDSSPASPFVTMGSPAVQSIQIGGTLTAGSLIANPSGSYSGSFALTFIQE